MSAEPPPEACWDADRYDRAFGFVAGHGFALVDMLDARPGERVLDLGCGTGTLTAEVAARGAAVHGVDADPRMVSAARARHPEMSFEVADAHELVVARPYDAVFSNAALHWMSDPDRVIANVREALPPGGRFVAEMGGADNVATILTAVRSACAEFDVDADPWLRQYYPSPAEHASRLESGGFDVRWMHYFARPTPLTECPNGVADWVRMFRSGLLAGMSESTATAVLDRVNALTRDALQRQDGTWVADYQRLRFVAVRR